MNFITELFNHYGYWVLFAALTLELIALPTPGETLMTYCGFLVFQGKLNWGLSITVAALGVITGITISYFIGRRLGTPFFRKYGSYVHLGTDRLDKTSEWFERYGNGLLVAAYFIPGIRHLTGYFSGVTRMPFKRFALNAYLGAVIWTGTFISLGKLLGSNWEKLHGYIRQYLIGGGIALAIGLICIYLYKNYKTQILEFVINSLSKLIRIFHSLGRVKRAILGVTIVFVALCAVVIGLIQDFFAHEFSQFDDIVSFLVSLSFSGEWTRLMSWLRLATAPGVLTVLGLVTASWIMVRGRNRILELRFLIVAVLGGEVLEEGLRLFFHRIGPLGLSSRVNYTFPSEAMLMAVVAYGFAAFLILRHARNRWLGTLAVTLSIGISLLTGLSLVFLKIGYPSDVVAGGVFGGIWLCLNIVLLEVYRVLPQIEL